MANFEVNDRRGRRFSGIIVGETVEQAKRSIRSQSSSTNRTPSAFSDTNRFTQPRSRNQSDDETIREMRLNRRINRLHKRGASGMGGAPGSSAVSGLGGANINFATGRPRDPMFYWRENNLPYDLSKDDELKKVRTFCDLLYLTDPIIASAIDIFTKYPLQGMDIRCQQDEQIEQFHQELFFSELSYKSYLVDVGHCYWTVGEAWPLGSFNETLGVWDDDELLSPEDVEVERSLLVKDPRFLIRLPQTLRKVLQERSPRWEYDTLIKSYPELQHYAAEDSLMPVSNMLLKQLRFKADIFHKRGIPILMRAFRTIMQQEALNAAMDAIADRLYTPLILVKLGASAQDLGTEVPWIPTQDDLEVFEESMDAALAGDFRLLVNHFATQIESVFGRENMPDLSADFERIEDRLLQVFGMSKTMLNGASSGETYAADALNRDIMVDLLTTYQQVLKDFFDDRARIVAEAQEHYDFDVRGGKRYVKMEEVLQVDEESGEEIIVEQPKLLVPELTFRTLSLQDEEAERQFREMLVQAGIPITMKDRLSGTGIEFEDMLEESQNERVKLAVMEQETRRETWKALKAAGLPIPQDLQSDFQPVAKQPGEPVAAGQDTALPQMGLVPQDYPALAPTMQDQQMLDQQTAVAPQQTSNGQPVAMPMVAPAEGDQRPPESDEQRGRMPKPAKQVYGSHRISREARRSYDRAVRGRIRQATKEHYVPPDNSNENPDRPQDHLPTGKFAAPKHVAMRQYVSVPPEWRAVDPESSED